MMTQLPNILCACVVTSSLCNNSDLESHCYDIVLGYHCDICCIAFGIWYTLGCPDGVITHDGGISLFKP